MVSPQLLDYIRQQSVTGIPKEEISKSLIASGWQVSDINEAFATLTNSQLVTPSSSVQTFVQSPAQIADSNGHKGKWVIVVVALLLIVAGSAFAAYHYGLITLSATTQTQQPVATTTTPSAPITAIPNTSIASTSKTTIVTSEPTTSKVKSEIDEYGVDLYALKQGATTIHKTTQTKTEVVYTRNGNELETKTSITVGSEAAAIFTNNSTIYPSEIDMVNNVNLDTLKQGVTIINKTTQTQIDVVYTRNGDQIERKVSTIDASGGKSTDTLTISLKAREQMLSSVKDIGTKLASCSDTTSANCRGYKVFLDFINAKCINLQGNVEISKCMIAATMSVWTSQTQ